MRRRPWWMLLVLGLSGCVMTSSGFNRSLLESRLQEEAAKATDEDIKLVQQARPQLRFPCRVAVALKSGQGDWRWTVKDRQVMDGWAQALRQESFASDVVFMSSMFVQGEGL